MGWHAQTVRSDRFDKSRFRRPLAGWAAHRRHPWRGERRPSQRRAVAPSSLNTRLRGSYRRVRGVCERSVGGGSAGPSGPMYVRVRVNAARASPGGVCGGSLARAPPIGLAPGVRGLCAGRAGLARRWCPGFGSGGCVCLVRVCLLFCPRIADDASKMLL